MSTTTDHLNNNPMMFFISVVESVEDPLMLGRVKIRVLNENDSDELPLEHLHYAYPMTPTHSAALNGVGISPTGIAVGSYALGFYFDQKEKNIPFIIGTYNKIPTDKTHDVAGLAREINTIVKSYYKVNGTQVEPTSAYGAKYPFNKTYTTQTGHVIEVDDTPDHERINIHHKSGSYTEINQDGRWVRKVVGDDYEIVITDKNVYVDGNLSITVGGNVTISAGKNIALKAAGNIDIEAGGNIAVKAGGTIASQSTGITTIDGSTVITNS
jgi:hypothetical protein